MSIEDIRNTLLKLDDYEKWDRKKVLANYLFYRGKSLNLELAKIDEIWYGQNWPVNDNIDYAPTQDIRNKVKQLLKKQARFMFSCEPTLVIKPDNVEDKESAEELRRFLEDIFENNQFWKNTRKAFLMATIKKRILLRIEYIQGKEIQLKYEDIDSFSYKQSNNELIEVRIFEADPRNVTLPENDDKRVYYLNKYVYKRDEQGALQKGIVYIKETYTKNNFDSPVNVQTIDTGFETMPCWLIVNGGELNNSFGESDLDDLIEPQKLYNKRNSDFADALRFQLFGAVSIIDGKDEDVNRLQIRPNAIHAIRTTDVARENGKQASLTREEYNMGNASAMETYLNRLDNDMRDLMDMPSLKDLSNIPSAKAIRYLYNDFIARCEEKWSDWEPIFIQMIKFILELMPLIPSKRLYSNFDKSWLTLKCSISFTHNYPIPDDSDVKKSTAMQEVITNVRSISSYIKEYSGEEDAEAEFNRMLYEKAMLNSVENGSSIPELDDNTGDIILPELITTTTTIIDPTLITTTTTMEQTIVGE